MTTLLPTPVVGDEPAWVRRHLHAFALEPVEAIEASPRWRGGQSAANAALAAFSVRGYAATRNEVWPPERRGASGLSPWIRHGLLPLKRVWDHVENGPSKDVDKFRSELLWQEYARHLYARLGSRMNRPLRAQAPPLDTTVDPAGGGLRCMEGVGAELRSDGWLVNQTRMWFASHWSVRCGARWQDGEEHFFRHLLDGSRAANRLGWQWTIGTATGKPYGFSRWQVEKRSPGLCATCTHRHRCPIQTWPPDPDVAWLDRPAAGLRSDPNVASTAGPLQPQLTGTPDAVWITAESLGDEDPALAMNQGVPVVFVFDAPLLASLRLSGKRLVFLAECLADFAQRREVHIHLGRPAEVLRGKLLATTFAPVPGWQRIVADLSVVSVHPWPWLIQPHSGSVQSFTAWRRDVERSTGSLLR
jgi:deoxyribodipyrimidine photo-lyase